MLLVCSVNLWRLLACNNQAEKQEVNENKEESQRKDARHRPKESKTPEGGAGRRYEGIEGHFSLVKCFLQCTISTDDVKYKDCFSDIAVKWFILRRIRSI